MLMRKSSTGLKKRGSSTLKRRATGLSGKSRSASRKAMSSKFTDTPSEYEQDSYDEEVTKSKLDSDAEYDSDDDSSTRARKKELKR